MKENCVLFMNCHSSEYAQYLLSCPIFYNKYNVIELSTYLHISTPKIIVDTLITASLIITHNVKQYEQLTPKNIRENINKTAKIIVVEFFRFDGFIIPSTVVDRGILNVPVNISSISYDEYYNLNIDDIEIRDHFQQSLNKLKDMDSNSDVKFYDYFINNYKHKKLFSDGYHPLSLVFLHLSQQILQILEIDWQLRLLPDHPLVSGIRQSIICKKVKDVLDLRFDDTIVSYCNNIRLSQQQYFDFLKYLDKNNLLDMNAYHQEIYYNNYANLIIRQ
jgi:hypothetical protein